MKEKANDAMTMAVVTHEIGFAKKVADHVVFVEEGIIEEEGPPEETLSKSKSKRPPQFLNTILFGVKERPVARKISIKLHRSGATAMGE